MVTGALRHAVVNRVQPHWYEASSTCNKVVDYNAAVWVYGGCQYDHSVGGCSNLEVQDVTQGCIPYFEQYMASKVRRVIHPPLDLDCAAGSC